MAYYTDTELRLRAHGTSAYNARESLRRFSKAAYGPFDVFLSHSVHDAVLILGVRNWLQEQGLTVYVDWIDDPLLDRSKVSADTASILRRRMQRCTTLMYVTSRAAQRSRWMPWELGYFDGLKGSDQVSILPIEDHADRQFDGQEYLGLYRVIEKRSTTLGYRPYAYLPSRQFVEPLQSFAKATGRLERVGR